MLKNLSLQEYISISIIGTVKKVLSFTSIYSSNVVDSSQLTDVQIIEKIRNGEKDKYEILVDRYSQKMFRYLYNYFNFSQQVAEDVVQDIFLRAWQKLDKYDTSYTFNSWIYRLAHNYCIDYIKKQKDVSQLDGNEKDGASVKDDLEQDFKRQLTKSILEKLEGNYKEVLILYYFEEKSYEEISQILDIPKNTVGTLVHRAKNKLKEVINSDEVLKDSLVFDL